MRKTKSIKKNAILNLIKNICTIGFPLITIPYLSRTLGITDYGKFNYANSIISYFILLAGLGFSTYSIREGSKFRTNKEEISEFASEIFTLNCFSGAISLFLLYVLIFAANQLSSYRLILMILSFNIVANTIGLDWINTVFEDYSYLTIRYILIQIISLILLFIFVHKRTDLIIYTIIYLFSQVAANLMNVFYIRRYVEIKFTLSINEIKHLKPSIIFFVNNLAITIYVNSDLTLLGLLANDEAVGIYSIASKIYSATKMLAVATLSVTIPRLTLFLGQSRYSDYSSLINKIFQFIISISIPMFIGLFMISKSTMILVTGNDGTGFWTLRLLAVASIFSILAYFYSQCILIPYNGEKYFLYSTITGASLNILLNMFFIPTFGYFGASFTTLISEVTVCLMVRSYSIKYFKLRSPFGYLKSILISSIIVIIICIIGNYIQNLMISVIFCIILSAMGVLTAFIIFHNPCSDYILKIINTIKKPD